MTKPKRKLKKIDKNKNKEAYMWLRTTKGNSRGPNGHSFVVQACTTLEACRMFVDVTSELGSQLRTGAAFWYQEMRCTPSTR